MLAGHRHEELLCQEDQKAGWLQGCQEQDRIPLGPHGPSDLASAACHPFIHACAHTSWEIIPAGLTWGCPPPPPTGGGGSSGPALVGPQNHCGVEEANPPGEESRGKKAALADTVSDPVPQEPGVYLSSSPLTLIMPLREAAPIVFIL